MTLPTQAWITNDPEVATALRAADAAHQKAREAATLLPLAAKVTAFRRAAEARTKAYTAAGMVMP